MALMDSDDLVTSRSSSEKTPVFNGLKLRQSQLDTERQALEALQHARERAALSGRYSHSRLRRGREREEVDLTATSDSDSSSLGRGSWRRYSRFCLDSSPLRSSPHWTPPALSQQAGDAATSLQRRSNTQYRDGGASALTTRSSQSAEAVSVQQAAWRSAQQLVALLTTVLALRGLLGSLADSVGAGQTAVPAMLAAALAASALTVNRAARRSLDLEKMMETDPAGWCHRAVSLRLGGVHWTLWTLELTLDEAFGLSCVLVLLALLLFLENWGLHGPRACRWLAVVGHAALMVLLMVAAYHWLTRHLRVPERGGSEVVSVVWLCLTMGNASTAMWAALAWWCTAAGSSTAAETSSKVLPTPLPVVAMGAVHAANFWIARRAHQPLLLAICVAVAAVSMVTCCLASCGSDSPWLVPAPGTPAIFVAFCVLSAWLLWQDLLRSL